MAARLRAAQEPSVVDQERRRFSRFQIPVKVRIRGGGVEETCLSSEVGMGGCRITLSRRLPEGMLLQVELSSTRLPEPVSGTAQIAWVSKSAPWHTGLSFAPTLVEAMSPFLRALVGTSRLVPVED